MSTNVYYRTGHLSAAPIRLAAWFKLMVLAGVVAASSSVWALSAYEVDQLSFMKEEEKLARDVYTTLGEFWGLPVFTNIARSEQTHMDRMDDLLVAYGLPDPARPEVGVFTNPVLQHLYNRLVETGATSPRAALGVGEMIEITDIRDLGDLIAGTEEPAIIDTAERLRNASYNHLAAFRGQLALLPAAASPSNLESASTLTNLSVRGTLGEDEATLILGFVISGETPLQVLITTRGPSIAEFGVTDAASDPFIEVFNGASRIGADDNGGAGMDEQLLADAGIHPLAPRDAALLISLAPGTYTVMAHNQGTGSTGLAEVYALPTANQNARLTNLSVRGPTAAGDDHLIAGFIISGDDPLPVMIRSLGPTLTSYGVTSAAIDLDAAIFDGSGSAAPAVIADWLRPEVLGTVDSGWWPETPVEPLALMELNPGPVTVHAFDPTGGEGIALIEISLP